MWAKCCLMALISGFPGVVSAQGLGIVSSPVATSTDGSAPVPVLTGLLGIKDAAALTEITSHLAAVGVGPWLGMRATGKISFGPDPTTYDATLTNLGRDRFRLDAGTKKGPMSVRFLHSSGKSRGGNDATSVLPSETALTGLFPFELLRIASLPKDSTSVLDHGLVSLNGTTLHRITLEMPSIGRNPLTKTQQTVAVDFYLDPISHLLVKTVAFSAQMQGQRAKLLDEVTYADYRQVGTAMIPFRITETLQGEQSMSLQLSDVQLNPTLDATYFEF